MNQYRVEVGIQPSNGAKVLVWCELCMSNTVQKIVSSKPIPNSNENWLETKCDCGQRYISRDINIMISSR